MEEDLINHPKHYTSHPSGVECIEVAEELSFCLGNAFKYLFRCSEKGARHADLEKALWYIEREWENGGPSDAYDDALRDDVIEQGVAVICCELQRSPLIAAVMSYILDASTAGDDRLYFERKLNLASIALQEAIDETR